MAVSEEMLDAAKADLEVKSQTAESKVRTRKTTKSFVLWVDESTPLPVELDFDLLSPTSYLTEPFGSITGSVDTQQFTVVEERLRGLTFAAPAQNLPKKRLYVVKAFHLDGRLGQIPFEPQINNTAGGELEDAIGLHREQRKGRLILIDWNTMIPVYCAARDCWAASMRKDLIERFPAHADAVNTGFCSMRHAQHTMPNRFRDAEAILGGMFGAGATTSRVWGS